MKRNYNNEDTSGSNTFPNVDPILMLFVSVVLRLEWIAAFVLSFQYFQISLSNMETN